jgi:hypothetical protein
MNKSMIIASGAAFIVSGSVFAQDIPDPNPIANPDGTMTWYTGNNTQYPVIQEVIDACTDGDEIVVMAGLYTESLSLNRNDITLRCATASAAAALADVTRAESSWQSVTFWNPTEGFDNNNDHAILLGANTTNTYVGRPRMFSQLSNGSIVFNEMPVSNTAGNEEWDADQEMIEVCQEIGGAGAANVAADIFQEGMEAGVVIAGDADHAMIFWSRSIDDVAVRSAGSAATLSFCTITSQNGFGGGIIVDGAGDSSSYLVATSATRSPVVTTAPVTSSPVAPSLVVIPCSLVASSVARLQAWKTREAHSVSSLTPVVKQLSTVATSPTTHHLSVTASTRPLVAHTRPSAAAPSPTTRHVSVRSTSTRPLVHPPTT